MKNKPIPSPAQNPNGLHQKYIISKTNGQPVDTSAEYFVLRLDDGGHDPIHVAAGRKAMMTYATEIQGHLPQLAADIRSRYSEMTRPGWPKHTPKGVAVKPIHPGGGPRELPGKAVIDSGGHDKPDV